MDMAANSERIDSPSTEIEESQAEKRLLDVGNVGDQIGASPAKKARGEFSSIGCMKRVAELVLVLSAMSRMRGCRAPTSLEVEMMSEARSKLVNLCVEFAPHDIIPQNAADTVIEDLGLSNVGDPGFGFRPPKMSIAEKMLLTKKKMEQSGGFHAHSGSSKPHSNIGGNRYISQNRHEKQNRISMLETHPPPLGVSTSVLHNTAMNGVKSVAPPSSLANTTGRRPNLRADGGLPHPSPPPIVGDKQRFTETPINVRSEKMEGTSGIGRDSHNPVQATKETLHHQPVHGIYVHMPPFNSHGEICRYVQNFLQTKTSTDGLTWIPPSNEYVNTPLTCHICKITVTEVETVLVCDSCEKGYHLKCIQSKGIPGVEWHCQRCLALSNGKPLPPKYGRVLRNIGQPKLPQLGVDDEAQSSDRKTLDPEIKENPQEANPGVKKSTPSIPGSSMGNVCIEPHACEETINTGTTADLVIPPQQFNETDPSVDDSENETSKLLEGEQKKHENVGTFESVTVNDLPGTSPSSSSSTDGEDDVDDDGGDGDEVKTVEWVGDAARVVDGSVFYGSCRVGGVDYRLNDYVLVPSTDDKLEPSKIQTMWEDERTKVKWVGIDRCFFPSDLPSDVGHPCGPESNEVYESNHSTSVMACLIRNPCDVLPPNKFEEEMARRSSAGSNLTDRTRPVFVCKWWYDECRRLFKPILG